MSVVTCETLAFRLDSRKILLSEHGYQRDWRGVSQLLGGSNCQHNQLHQVSSPTLVLLQRYRLEPVETLRECLALVGRHDVWDAAESLIERDTSEYERRLDLSGMESDSAGFIENYSNPTAPTDIQLLCVGDAERLRRGESLVQFDALLLYDESDADFAAEIVSRMENRGLLLCERERHLLPGIPIEHEGTMKLIQERCRRVIVVLSPMFLQSPVNNFLTMFASFNGQGFARRSVIPCKLRDCVLPAHLACCSRLDFTRRAGSDTLWQRMFDSLSSHTLPPTTQHPHSSHLLPSTQHAHSSHLPQSTQHRALSQPTDSPDSLSRISGVEESAVSDGVPSSSPLKEKLAGESEDVVPGPDLPSTTLLARILRIPERVFRSKLKSLRSGRTTSPVSPEISSDRTAQSVSMSSPSSSKLHPPDLFSRSSEFLVSSSPIQSASDSGLARKTSKPPSWTSVLKATRKKRKNRSKHSALTPAS